MPPHRWPYADSLTNPTGGFHFGGVFFFFCMYAQRWKEEFITVSGKALSGKNTGALPSIINELLKETKCVPLKLHSEAESETAFFDSLV